MTNLAQALEDCRARLASGEATLEECLARYPEHANDLRRLLATASQLESGRSIRPSLAFKARARTQLAAHTRMHPRQPQVKPGPTPLPGRFSLVFGRAFGLAFNLMAILLLFLATGTVLAQTALPGDAMYGWKVTSERVWRAVHFDPLRTDLLVAARRVQELIRVVGDSRAEPVARQSYQQSLFTLTQYTAPDSREIISNALHEQKNQLDQAGVSVPELDRFLRVITIKEVNLQLDNQAVAAQNGLITYTVTITNTGPASPIAATIVSRLSPVEKLVSAGDTACRPSAGGTITCAIDNLMAEIPQELRFTTAFDPCYAGVISNTATIATVPNIINTNSNNSAMAVSTITTPYPRPAQVAYVQSHGRTHSLGLVDSGGQMRNEGLHLHAAAPVWSPDGTKVAFFGEEGISELAGLYSQGNGIWVVDFNKGQAQNPRQLLALDHIKNMAWSPDETMLAFEVGPPGLPHEIWVVDASDGQLLSRFPGQQPAWHPSSQKLAIKSCAPQCGLWQVNLDGRTGQQLTFDDTDSYPAWSPTGQHLAFSSQRQGNWEIYLLQPAEGDLLRLTERAGTDTTPVFGPCGQEIYLRTDTYGSWWITLMKLDGSDERKIQEGVGPSDDWGLARPAVH